MKNFLRFFLTLVAIIGAYSSNFAQIITYPTPAQAITRGLDSTTLTVRIDFPACTNIRVTINTGATNNPGLIEYVPGSLQRIGGSAGVNISEFFLGDPKWPIFSVTNTTAGQYIIFTIKRRANCGSASASKDDIFVSGTGCNFQETDPNINTYNLLSPALTLVPPPVLNNVNLGTAYNRNFSVTNGGNGCLDTLFVWLKYNNGAAVLNSLSIGATALTPTFNSGDSVMFKIAGANLPGGRLCNGQTVVFTENVTFLKCGANTKYGDAWNSYNNEFCETDEAIRGITMDASIPRVTASILNPDYNFCFTGDSKKLTVRLTNSGSGPANNIKMFLNNEIIGWFNGNNYWDTTRAYTIKNANGDSIGVLNNFTGVKTHNINITSCASTQNIMREGTGSATPGVIIPAGSYIDVEIWTRTRNLTCSPNWCRTFVGWVALVERVFYTNQCNTASYSDQQRNLMERGVAFFSYNIEGPTDIFPGTFNVKLNFADIRTGNNLDNSGLTYMCVPLPSGITTTATSVQFGPYTFGASTVSPRSSNTTDTLWIGPITQQIEYSNPFTVTLPFIATCGSSGVRNFNFFVLNKYSNCSPWVRFSCSNYSTVLHCPTPCPKGGATPVKFDLSRINYGLPDNDDNHQPDVTGALDFTKVATHRSVNGDTLKATWNVKIHPNVDPADPNFNQSFTYIYADFNLQPAYPNPTSFKALPNAVVHIYNAAGIFVNSCVVTPTLAGHIAHYEFPASCRGGGATVWA